MQDYEEPTPPMESRLDDYPEPTPPDDYPEPEPPIPEIQDETPNRPDDPIWELIQLAGRIDGRTEDSAKEIGELIQRITDLTQPKQGSGGDPLQPTMDAILEMLTQLGQRQTAMEARLTAMEEAQGQTYRVVQIIRDHF